MTVFAGIEGVVTSRSTSNAYAVMPAAAIMSSNQVGSGSILQPSFECQFTGSRSQTSRSPRNSRSPSGLVPLGLVGAPSDAFRPLSKSYETHSRHGPHSPTGQSAGPSALERARRRSLPEDRETARADALPELRRFIHRRALELGCRPGRFLRPDLPPLPAERGPLFRRV